MAHGAGLEAPFGMRTSGLGAPGLMQNPTWDFVDAAKRIPFDVVRAAVRRDDDYSEDDFKRLRGVLPFGNTLPVATGLGIIGARLPKHSIEE